MIGIVFFSNFRDLYSLFHASRFVIKDCRFVGCKALILTTFQLNIRQLLKKVLIYVDLMSSLVPMKSRRNLPQEFIRLMCCIERSDA